MTQPTEKNSKFGSLVDHYMNMIDRLASPEFKGQSEEDRIAELERIKTMGTLGSVMVNGAKEQNKQEELRLKRLELEAKGVNTALQIGQGNKGLF